METKHSPVTCRWAVPTLLLSYPLWLDAWDSPWACVSDAMPRALETTDICLSCCRWQPTPERERAVKPVGTT